MKKLHMALAGLLAGCMLLMTACGGSSTTTPSTPAAAGGSSAVEDSSVVAPNNDLLDVEVEMNDGQVLITVPASFIGDDFDGALTENDVANGFTGVVINEDGSATYSIPKKLYDVFIVEMEQQIRTSMNELNEIFTSIQTVELNDDMTVCTLVVNGEEYKNGFDAFASLSIYGVVAVYKIYSGTAADEQDIQLAITVLDEESGETIDSYNYPEILG